MSNGHLATSVQGLVQRYLERFETHAWNRFRAFSWDSVQGGLLTEEQIDALKTAMLVEDHIPGYSKAYYGMLSLDPGLPLDELLFRRQMLHFVFLWACDEDRHAHTLENYLRASGRVDPAALTSEMLTAVAKPYRAPHDEPMQMAVYTVIQEKATQVFYSCLRDVVEEPVLKRVLDSLSQDEARHCGFFTDLLRMYLAVPGGADYALIKEAVVGFKMPLHGTLDNYKRRAITMMRAATGYHYRNAFALIEQAVGRYAGARSDSRSHTLEDLLKALEARSDRHPAGRRHA
ncbi:MAG: acyl-ACP desaturase [Elusimicrobia bacterium]|nr:acyl-ACP desaturase [Elusimicrobiota bacterium]